MKIDQQNFQDVCVLYQNGFVIKGRTANGVILEYCTASANDAGNAIKTACKRMCKAANCKPVAEDTDPAEIYAEIS